MVSLIVSGRRGVGLREVMLLISKLVCENLVVKIKKRVSNNKKDELFY